MRNAKTERKIALLFLFCSFFVFDSSAFSFYSSFSFPMRSFQSYHSFEYLYSIPDCITSAEIAAKDFFSTSTPACRSGIFTGNEAMPDDSVSVSSALNNYIPGDYSVIDSASVNRALGNSKTESMTLLDGTLGDSEIRETAFPDCTLSDFMERNSELTYEMLNNCMPIDSGAEVPAADSIVARNITGRDSGVNECENGISLPEKYLHEKEGMFAGDAGRGAYPAAGDDKYKKERFPEDSLEKSPSGRKLRFEQGRLLLTPAGNGREENSGEKELVLFKPDLVLKTKYEVSTESGTSRFTVRNSRLGLEGDIASYMSYRFQVELSSEGKFEVLDLYADIRPAKGLSIVFGQCSLPIYNSYTTSPSKLMFANRPFIGKYFSKSRDIGVDVKYTIKQTGFPIAVEAGVFNGEGINNPKWTKTPSFGGRVLFGDMEGFRATAKVYKSKQSDTENFFFWGADARYEGERFKIEAEVMDRYNKADKRDLFSAYAQGTYSFPVNKRIVDEILPAIRWDAMGYDFPDRGFGVNRLTVGVNFVLNMRPFNSVFRIDYEHYFRRDKFEEFSNAEEMDESKFTLELLIYF